MSDVAGVELETPVVETVTDPVAPEGGPITVDRWRETLPEDLRENSVIKETTDVTALAKRLVDANAYIGKTFKMPENGDTNGWNDVYNKLGRPETVEGYEFERPAENENIPYSQELEGSFLEAAHKAGLNNSQVKLLVDWNQEQVTGQYTGSQEVAAEALSTLKKEWGTAFDERLEVVDRIMNQFGDDGSEMVAKDNIPMIKMLYDMGKNLVEGGTGGEGNAPHGGSLTPKEALGKINEKMRDKTFMGAYMSKKDPTHDAAVQEMVELNAMAYPEPEDTIL